MTILPASRSAQRLAVFGLGASGRAAAHALAAAGADVAAWDDVAEARAAAAREGVPLSDLARADWTRFHALVLSPGVPLSHPEPHPVARRAAAAGVSVIGDIELLAEACPEAFLIGVTGTNGKSTTAALIRHALQAAGRPVQLGGNFGPPALGLAPPRAGECIVLELSSYQLDLTARAAFDAAVLLNVTPDHLDRHGGMAGYVAAKKRIFRTGRPRQTAIVGVDDPPCRAAAGELIRDGRWRVRTISALREADVRVTDGRLADAADGASVRVPETLRGSHNWQNAAAAWAVARARGVPPAAIAAAFETWPGLPHRMETVAEAGGVRFVNDSKATNGEAAARALQSFRDVYWIAGGIAKEDGLAPTEPHLGRVRRAYLIGDAAAAFARHLKGRAPAEISGNLEDAVRSAVRQATEDGAAAPVVLLSPACASFDQYRDFAARGDHFRALARELEGAP